MLHIRVRPHPGEQPIVSFSQPPGHFPAHVHLDQRELLEILLVDLMEVGCRKTDCGAIFDGADGGAARTEVHDRHLPEAIALFAAFRGGTRSHAMTSSTATLPASRTNIEIGVGRVRGKSTRSPGRTRPGTSRAEIGGCRPGSPPKTGMRCRRSIRASCMATLPELPSL